MSYLDWKVGMKVVCVDDAPRLTQKYPYRAHVGVGVRAGQIYTVTGYRVDSTGAVGLLLLEAKPRLKPLIDGSDRGFFADRFRPVQTRKTDISIFQRLLTDPNIRIEEDA